MTADEIVAAIEAAVTDLGTLVAGGLPEEDLDTLIGLWSRVEDTRRALTITAEDLADLIGRTMPEKRHTAPGVTVERHRKTSRTEWDRDALLSAVLDSRLVDTTTGEVTDETPLDRVTHVWHLGAPRVTALRARGIDPDEFCRTEHLDRWTLRTYTT